MSNSIDQLNNVNFTAEIRIKRMNEKIKRKERQRAREAWAEVDSRFLKKVSISKQLVD